LLMEVKGDLQQKGGGGETDRGGSLILEEVIVQCQVEKRRCNKPGTVKKKGKRVVKRKARNKSRNLQIGIKSGVSGSAIGGQLT